MPDAPQGNEPQPEQVPEYAKQLFAGLDQLARQTAAVVQRVDSLAQSRQPAQEPQPNIQLNPDQLKEQLHKGFVDNPVRFVAELSEGAAARGAQIAEEKFNRQLSQIKLEQDAKEFERQFISVYPDLTEFTVQVNAEMMKAREQIPDVYQRADWAAAQVREKINRQAQAIAQAQTHDRQQRINAGAPQGYQGTPESQNAQAGAILPWLAPAVPKEQRAAAQDERIKNFNEARKRKYMRNWDDAAKRAILMPARQNAVR